MARHMTVWLLGMVLVWGQVVYGQRLPSRPAQGPQPGNGAHGGPVRGPEGPMNVFLLDGTILERVSGQPEQDFQALAAEILTNPATCTCYKRTGGVRTEKGAEAEQRVLLVGLANLKPASTLAVGFGKLVGADAVEGGLAIWCMKSARGTWRGVATLPLTAPSNVRVAPTTPLGLIALDNAPLNAKGSATGVKVAGTLPDVVKSITGSESPGMMAMVVGDMNEGCWVAGTVGDKSAVRGVLDPRVHQIGVCRAPSGEVLIYPSRVGGPEGILVDATTNLCGKVVDGKVVATVRLGTMVPPGAWANLILGDMVREVKISEEQQKSIVGLFDKYMAVVPAEGPRVSGGTRGRGNGTARGGGDTATTQKTPGEGEVTAKERREAAAKRMSDYEAAVYAVLTAEQKEQWLIYALVAGAKQAFRPVEFSEEQMGKIKALAVAASKGVKVEVAEDRARVWRNLAKAVHDDILSAEQRKQLPGGG